MKSQRALLALAISVGLFTLAGCKSESDNAAGTAGNAGTTATGVRTNESADAFVARVNQSIKDMTPEITSAAWLGATYINADSQRVESAANERYLTLNNAFVEQAKTYDVAGLNADTARALHLLKVGASLPAPRDPARLKELTEIVSRMGGTYGAGKWCVPGREGKEDCKDIGQVSEILADTQGSTYEQMKAAWEGWHTIAVPIRPDYQRFVELTNEGAREMGFANTGEVWRAGYDMPVADFQAEADRLWGQVQPLYEQLQCYTREKLVGKYGEKGQVDGMIPAHLTGNLWQQDWSNLWPILEPYAGVGNLDVTGALQKQRDAILADLVAKAGGMRGLTATQQVDLERQADLEMATRMTKLAESFYTGLGMPALPDTFYTDSMLVQPRDRDVVCHASAWPMNTEGEVRMKMCIKPNEEELTTIYHELGHIFYYLAYKAKAPMFQNGAHDGFHEAIGDTIVLSMTPDYLASIGLVDKPAVSDEAVINSQMRMALTKVAFLPFGLMIDRWRWGVFDGSIGPDSYNAAWWDLKAKYQGVAPAEARGEQFFDPGAKYHVPGNTPYTRYFLSHVLQFQFYKSLCDAAGHTGPLYTCNFADNPEAGKRYWAMMERGSSQPWQQTLKELTGGEQMDASAVLEYFAPLQTWLIERNQGKSCGWTPGDETAAAPAAPAG